MSWRIAASLETLRAQFNQRYPNRSKASDGGIGDAAHASRSSDHNPWVKDGNGVGVVTARDFTHDPGVGMDIDRLTDELAASRDPRIKYIIANGYILDSRPGMNPWRWMRYSGSNPHTKHFHLSVMSSANLYDDARPWNLPSFGGAPAAPVENGDDDLTPEQDAMLRRIENELLGPRGSRGEITGWGTEVGPRTVVAMLVELTNALLAPRPSRVAGSEVQLSAVEAIRNTDAAAFVAAYQSGTVDAQAVADALRPVLGESIGAVVRDAVNAALGADNESAADAVANELARRLGVNA